MEYQYNYDYGQDYRFNGQYGDYCKMATIFLMLQSKKGMAMAKLKTSCAKANAIKNLMAFVMK